MHRLKKPVTALTLTLVFALGAFGGEIPSPGYVPSNCPQGQTCIQSTGEIPTTPDATESFSLDPLTEVALDLVSLVSV